MPALPAIRCTISGIYKPNGREAIFVDHLRSDRSTVNTGKNAPSPVTCKNGTVIAEMLRGCCLIREDFSCDMSLKLGTAKVFASILLLFVIAGIASAQSIYRLPAGTRFQLRITDEISSKFSSANDTFRTRLAAPVVVRDIVLIPAGTIVEGRVLNAIHAEFGGKNGRMEIQLETLRFTDNVFRPIYGVPSTPLGESTSESRKCPLGLAFSFFTKGREVSLKEDDVIEVVLKKDVVLPVKDY